MVGVVVAVFALFVLAAATQERVKCFLSGVFKRHTLAVHPLDKFLAA